MDSDNKSRHENHKTHVAPSNKYTHLHRQYDPQCHLRERRAQLTAGWLPYCSGRQHVGDVPLTPIKRQHVHLPPGVTPDIIVGEKSMRLCKNAVQCNDAKKLLSVLRGRRKGKSVENYIIHEYTRDESVSDGDSYYVYSYYMLDYAVKYNAFDTVSVIVQYGGDVNRQSKWNDPHVTNPLLHAIRLCYDGDTRMCEELLRFGADPNMPSALAYILHRRMECPIILWLFPAHIANIMRILLENGANPYDVCVHAKQPTRMYIYMYMMSDARKIGSLFWRCVWHIQKNMNAVFDRDAIREILPDHIWARHFAHQY